MPILSRFAPAVAALALCAPAVASGQASSIAQDGAGVSTQPPVRLGGADSGPRHGATTPSSPRPASTLPNTGSDPRLLLLTGVALLLSGVGLRLRTADAELY